MLCCSKVWKGPLSSLRISMVGFCSEKASKGIYNHHRVLDGETHKEWFAISEELTKARESSLPHLVFLEGAEGTGKKEMMGRLAKLGYTTFAPAFYNLLEQNEHNISIAEKIVQKEIESVAESLRSGEKKHKENLVFHNRSLLSMLEYFPHAEQAKVELSKVYSNYSIILCKSDPIKRKQRVSVRQFYEDGLSQDIVDAVRENDQVYLDSKADKYAEYLIEGDVFDGSVYTTSAKQGAAAILSLYGIKPKKIVFPTRKE